MCIIHRKSIFLYVDTRSRQAESSKLCLVSLLIRKATLICRQTPWTFTNRSVEGIVEEVPKIICQETGKLLNYCIFKSMLNRCIEDCFCCFLTVAAISALTLSVVF